MEHDNTEIRVGTCQGPLTEGDPQTDTHSVLRVIAEQAAHNLHFLCFPETFLTGYAGDSIRKTPSHWNPTRFER